MKKMLGALALAMCSIAQAEQVNVWATYTGFFDEQRNVFDPSIERVMYASVDDRNGDGVYDRSEVLNFFFGAISGGSGPCNPWGLRSYSCLTDFSYDPNGQLTFSGITRTDFREAGPGDVNATVVSGESYIVSGGINQTPWSKTLRWTADTRLSISPVPEPATIGMLATGLAVLGLMRRRRAGR